MYQLIEKIESVLSAIRGSELKRNSKASAKALEIKTMIDELKKLKMKTENPKIQGVLSYIDPKALLEN